MVGLWIKKERVGSINWIGVLKYQVPICCLSTKSNCCNLFWLFIALISITLARFTGLTIGHSFSSYFLLHSFTVVKSICLCTTWYLLIQDKQDKQKDGVWKIVDFVRPLPFDVGFNWGNSNNSGSAIRSGKYWGLLRGLGRTGPALWHFVATFKRQISLHGSNPRKLITITL